MTTSYLSISEFPGDGVTTEWEFNFAGGYISRDHVLAYIKSDLGVVVPYDVTSAFISDFKIEVTPAVPVGSTLRIYRDTPREEPIVNFTGGSNFTEANLDLLARQTIFAVAEAFDAGAYAAVNDLLGAAGATLASAEAALVAAEAADATFNSDGIQSLVTNLSKLVALYTDLAAINAVYASLAAVNTVSTGITEVNAVATNIVPVSAVATNIASVNTVSSNMANIIAALADLPALASKLSLTGGVLTGHVEGVAGASGAQLPQSREASPPSEIRWFARNTAPPGFLKANGASVSRTTYSALFAAIGTTFGVGNGATTFTLPDMRGEFPRGWDDARGIDPGRAFGSAQAQGTQDHTHRMPMGFFSGFMSGWEGAGNLPIFGSEVITGTRSTVSATSDTGTFRVAHTDVMQSRSGESRPRNIALLACIKY